MEETMEPKKRGRPPVEHIKPRTVVQIRIDKPMLLRINDAKDATTVYGRCEFIRILIHEALKKRGF